MHDIQKKFKRQAEILGLTIRGDRKVSVQDLIEIFNVERLTIMRDLQELRSAGINIHTTKHIVGLSSKINKDKLKQVLIQYLAICYSYNSFDKPTSLMLNKHKEKALYNAVILQRCIENHEVAIIEYEKESREIQKGKEISPIQMFQSENYWRVIAGDGKVLKQYHLNKILDIKPSGKYFKPIPRNEIDELFAYSWRSWLGYDKFEVRLLISKEWASKIKPKQVMVYQVIEERSDGSMELKLMVNNLDEIASWIVSRGYGVKVLEPAELKEIVTGLAEGTLKNYN